MSDGETALAECRLTTFHCHATKAIELCHFTSYSFECLPPLDDGALFEDPTPQLFAATMRSGRPLRQLQLHELRPSPSVCRDRWGLEGSH